MATDYEARYTPVHRSLHEEKTLGGAEKNWVLLDGILTMVAVIVFESLVWVGIGFVLYLFLIWIYKKDPVMRKVYIQYNKQYDVYDPWPHVEETANARPQGFDRGNLC